MSEELLYDLTGETDSPLDAGELRTLATRIETQPWHPSLELAASLTNAAALALERAETPADANGVRKGLLAFQRLFQLRGARLIEANLLVGQRLRTEWELGRLLADSRLRGGDRKSNSSDVSLIRLSDVGVSANQSMVFQRLAQLDRDELEHWIEENLNSKELSTAAAIDELWRELKRAAVAAEREEVDPAECPALIDVADAASLPLLDNYVDLIVTSPPYGLDVAYVSSPDAPDAWVPFMEAWLREAFRVSRDGGRLALNVPLDTTTGGFRPTYAQALAAAELAGWTYRFSIVWAEDNISKSVARGSMDSAAAPHVIAPVEMVAVFHKGDWKRETDKSSDLGHQDWLDWTNGLWCFSGESQPWEGHPAPFPLELPRRLVQLLSFPGDTVLDPFAGSGTTVVTAYELGREALGYDLSPQYVASARRRLVAAQKGRTHANR
jgi:site-specific DNA-methyltransferase (adenine-specific)